MQETEEDRIIQAVLDGDKEAFGLLVTRYQRAVYNLMYRMCGSAEDAADLTQETFLRAYDRLDRFDTGRRFFPWLYTVGVNQARDWARRKKPTDLLTEEEFERRMETGSPDEREERLNERLDHRLLADAVESLPLDYREAILLRYRHDMDMKEIAEVLGLSVSGAKMRIHRGLKKLKDYMREVDDDRS